MKNLLTIILILCNTVLLLSQNYSIDFDGTDDYIDLDNVPSSFNYSIEMWLKFDNITFDERILTAESSHSNILSLTVLNSDKIYLTVGGGNPAVPVTTTSLISNTWYHIALIRTSNTEVDFYLDGVQEVSTVIIDASVEWVDKMRLGSPFILNGNDYGLFMNGKVDEFRVWDGIRTHTEIQNNMNTELSGNESNLIAYYKFDNSSSPFDIEDCTSYSYDVQRVGYGGSNYLPQFDLDQPAALTDVICTGCIGSNNPTAVCQDITVSLDHQYSVIIVPNVLNDGSYDDCPGLEYNLNQDYLDCDDIGIVGIELMVTDTDGNTDTCLSNVTVNDHNNTQLFVQQIDTLCSGDDAIVTITGLESNTTYVNNKISDAEGGVSAFGTGDLNGNGLIDIVVLNGTADEVVLFENLDNGNFERTIITDTFDYPRVIQIVDFDGDSDLDILIGAYNDNEISILKNDGLGDFIGTNISNNADGVYSFKTLDVDKDNDLDIVAYLATNQEMNYYEIENGIIVSTQLLYNNYLQGQIFVGDFDGDTFDDFAILNTVFFNNSGFGFIRDYVGWNNIVGVGDADNDNDIDIIAIPPSSSGLPMRVYFNNGSGSFAYGFIMGSSNTNASVIDINNDGLNDIIAGRKNSISNVGPHIYINKGNGVYDQFNTINNASTFFIDVLDIDNDGQLELLQGFQGNIDKIEIDNFASFIYKLNGIADTAEIQFIKNNEWTINFGELPSSTHTFELTDFTYNTNCFQDTSVIESFYKSSDPIESWYPDLDQDSYGDANAVPIMNCVNPVGYVLDNTDCNDNDNVIFPGNPEVCDGKDNNCDGIFDEGLIDESFLFSYSLGDTIGLGNNYEFGSDVVVDNNYMVALAKGNNNTPDLDMIYIFERDSCNSMIWSFVKSFQDIGYTSISLSEGYLAVSNQDSSAVHLYYKDEGGLNNWGLSKIIEDTSALSFGAVSQMHQGLLAVQRSDANDDYVVIFEKDHGGLNNWGYVTKILIPSSVGTATSLFSISLDDEIMVVGSNQENEIHVYYRNYLGINNWGFVKTITNTIPGYFLGNKVELSNHRIAAPAFNQAFSGNIQIFEKDLGGTDNWGLVKTVFGYELSYNAGPSSLNEISFVGDYLLVGNVTSLFGPLVGGAALLYVDQCGTDNWGMVKRFEPTPLGVEHYMRLGTAVEMFDNQVLISAPGYDLTTQNSGTIAVFEFTNYEPEALCQNKSVFLTNGIGDISANDISVIDDCWVSGTAIDISSFDCSDIGYNTITLTVTDNNMNTTACESMVAVIDEFGSCCSDTLLVNNKPLLDGIYQAQDKLISNGMVSSMQDVEFKSGATICLLNGFEIELGALFEVSITPCY